MKIPERTEQLAALHLQTFGAPRPAEPRRAPRPSSNQAAADVQERMFQSQDADRYRRLYGGDWGGYQTRSEADFALLEGAAFWSGGDRQLTDQIFRDSGLYRDKWDKKHSGALTFGEYTLNRLFDRMTRFYEPPPVIVRGTPQPEPVLVTAAPAAGECSEAIAQRDARIAQLEGQLAERDVRIAQLEAERAAWSRLLSVDNKELKASDKIVGLATIQEIGHKQRRLGRSPDAQVPVSRGTIHRASGLSPSTISASWSRLANAGAFLKVNGHERPSRINEITGEIIEGDGRAVEVAYFQLPAATVAESIDHLARNRPVASGHGGDHRVRKTPPPPLRCPEHPDAVVERRCSECQQLLAHATHGRAEAPASQDATDKYDNHVDEGGVSTASQDATHLATLPLNLRVLLKCRRCHTWLTLDGECPKGCEVRQVTTPPERPPEAPPDWWGELTAAGGAS